MTLKLKDNMFSDDWNTKPITEKKNEISIKDWETLG